LCWALAHREQAAATAGEPVILLLAVIAGLLAGLARAWYGGRNLSPPHLRLIWLVPLAFAPQWLAFYLPATSRWLPEGAVAVVLVCSQSLLLLIALGNRKLAGFRALILGLALNLLVISLNGGMMPMSPETASQLPPYQPRYEAGQMGHRLGVSKNVLLSETDTRLPWLSDRFLLSFPQRVAFSLGDVFVAGGAFWLLWATGGATAYGAGSGRRSRYAHEFRSHIRRVVQRERVQPLDKRGDDKPGVLQLAVE
jgi:hypothetical protein